MREAVQKITTPIAAFADRIWNRIPDPSKQPVRRQVIAGAILSIAFHVCLLIFLLVSALVFPEKMEEQVPSNNVENQITIVPMPSRHAVVATPRPTALPIIDRRGLEESKKAPDAPDFEADVDMVAGSKEPASGLLPLPSQSGRTDRPMNDFATKDVRLGLLEPPPPQQQPIASSAGTEGGAPPPLYDPLPLAKEKIAEAQNAQPNQKLPEVARARSTPPQIIKRQIVGGRTILVPNLPGSATPPKTAPPSAKKFAETTVKTAGAVTATPPPTQMAKLDNHPKRQSEPSTMPRPRFQEQLDRTRVEGAISNRGTPGVNAVATPMGRYLGQLRTAVKSSWSALVESRMSLITPGTAEVSFRVTASGKVEAVVLVSNSSNSTFGALCEQAIQNAPIPPIPPSIVPSLDGGELADSVIFRFETF